MVFDLHLSETWLRKYQVSKGDENGKEAKGGEARMSETTECEVRVRHINLLMSTAPDLETCTEYRKGERMVPQLCASVVLP